MSYLRSLCMTFFALALAAGPAQASNKTAHSLEQLRAGVKSHLQAHYRGRFERLEISVNNLDPRLRLAPCGQPIAHSVRDLSGDGGSVSVHTQCPGPTPWSLYINARVDVFRQILVSTRALSRGELIGEDDVKLEAANTSTLRSGYITDPETIYGQQLRRSIGPGEPLRDALLERPLAVSRGDIVTLESGSGAINVSTRGEALANGRVGEQIRVKNLTSERVVSADVVGNGVVSVIY